MRRLIVLLALAVVVIGAPETSARSANHRLIVLGPVLGGNRVFWTEPGSVVRLWSPGTRTRAVDLPSHGVREIAASASAFAFATVDSETSTDGAWAGAPRGPFRRISEKLSCPYTSGVFDIDADGKRVAFAERYCRGSDSWARVVVRYLGGGRRIVPVDSRVTTDGNACCFRVRISGRYVAWDGNGWVKVSDLKTGRFVYKAPGGPWGFDLQADGKLAVVGWKQKGLGTVRVYAPREPRAQARELSQRVLFEDDQAGPIRLASDHVLFVRRIGASAEIVVSDLLGHRRRLAKVGAGSSARWENTGLYLLYGADFDGSSAAWATKRDDRVYRSCLEVCRKVADGVETVWVARADRGWVPRAIVSHPFTRIRAGP